MRGGLLSATSPRRRSLPPIPLAAAPAAAAVTAHHPRACRFAALAHCLPHHPHPPLQVWVKILEVRPEEGPRGGGFKLAASMKAVSQEDGKDLDPDNLMAAGGCCCWVLLLVGVGAGALFQKPVF